MSEVGSAAVSADPANEEFRPRALTNDFRREEAGNDNLNNSSNRLPTIIKVKNYKLIANLRIHAF